MSKKIYNYLSPDGITISPDYFDTPEEAHAYYETWKKRYEKQGYYSSNQGRIPLDEIDEYCYLIDGDDDEEE